VVQVPQRVFQQLLPERPTPEGCSNPVSSEHAAEQKPRRSN
jgi:hypothetical protein